MIFTEQEKTNEVLTFSGNNGGSYMHDALYESYIQSKIDAEDRLAFALKEAMVISEADYSNIRAIQEAKISDKIKATWKKFIAFIKGLVARFMESMTNIVLNEKDYLEKYKEIITKKDPKIGISYPGDYKVATNRLIAIEVPLFDYAKYKDALEAGGDNEVGELVKEIMKGKEGFSYDSAKTPAELFKEYFLALDKGQTKYEQGALPSKVMEDMYNFCHDFHKMQTMIDNDINAITQSTNRIEAMIKKELGDENANPTVKTVENPEQDSTMSSSKPKGNVKAKIDNEEVEAQVVDANGKPVESAKLTKSNGFIISEKVEIDKEDPSSSPISKMGSITNQGDDAAEKSIASDAKSATAGKKADDITKAAKKWRDVCSALVSAKLTACQTITNDYMKVIRDHVKSYGGADKKDTSNDVTPTGGTKYTKSAAKKALEDAERAEREAEAADKQAKNNK